MCNMRCLWQCFMVMTLIKLSSGCSKLILLPFRVLYYRALHRDLLSQAGNPTLWDVIWLPGSFSCDLFQCDLLALSHWWHVPHWPYVFVPHLVSKPSTRLKLDLGLPECFVNSSPGPEFVFFPHTQRFRNKQSQVLTLPNQKKTESKKSLSNAPLHLCLMSWTRESSSIRRWTWLWTENDPCPPDKSN